jgi:hypothetical protein
MHAVVTDEIWSADEPSLRDGVDEHRADGGITLGRPVDP